MVRRKYRNSPRNSGGWGWEGGIGRDPKKEKEKKWFERLIYDNYDEQI